MKLNLKQPAKPDEYLELIANKSVKPSTNGHVDQRVVKLMSHSPLLPPSFLNRLAETPLGRRMAAYVTCHEPSLQTVSKANLFSQRTEPVLIQGPTGTGKELLANILLNQKADHFLFAENCAAIPDGLFESIIFGHVKGAFTGAHADSPGLLRAAANGIAFLDEVGELPLSQQAKLLRVIQSRYVTPVGSVARIPISCRFVFATNRDLLEMTRAGTFRLDLYYRISALKLQTYALADRPDDVLKIAHAICEAHGYDNIPEVVPSHIINSPGNVRALEQWLLQLDVFGFGLDGVNPNLDDNKIPTTKLSMI